MRSRMAQAQDCPLPYEDEIRSVEGPDASRGGPEGTAPVLGVKTKMREP